MKNCSCPQRFCRSQGSQPCAVSATPWNSSSCLSELAASMSLLFANCSNVAVIRSVSPASCTVRSRGSSCVWTNLQHSSVLQLHCRGCLREALLHVTRCPCWRCTCWTPWHPAPRRTLAPNSYWFSECLMRGLLCHRVRYWSLYVL